MNKINDFSFTDDNDFDNQKKHIDNLFNFIDINDENGFNNYLNQFSIGTIDLNVKDCNGNYMLYLAVIKNNLKIVKNLIAHLVKLDTLDNDGFSILFTPIKLNYIKMVDLLLEADDALIGISLANIKDKFNEVPLFYAIRYGNIDIIYRLIAKKADPNFKNKDYMNSLHKCVLKKNINITKIILPRINNINSKTLTGYTCLHFACSLQQYDIAELLLKNGADPNLHEFEYELYPIFYPVIENNNNLIKLLLKYGSDINKQDYSGNTILHYAVLYDNIEILGFIINKASIGKNSNRHFDENINGLIDKNTLIKTNKHLLYSNIVNVDGRSICHAMLYKPDINKYVSCLKILLPNSDLNYQDNNGNTIMHLLVQNKIWLQFYDILCKKKLNIFITNNKNKTVFDIVEDFDRDKFVDLVSISYLFLLQKHPKMWSYSWQNKCSLLNNNINCTKLIKKHIVSNKISIPIRKTKTIIHVNNNSPTIFTSFTGSLLDTLCGYKYLILKHPKCRTILSLDQTKNTQQTYINYETHGVDINIKQHIVFFEIIWLYQRIILPPNFEKTFVDLLLDHSCDFIIIPIGIILSNGNHSNALFYDKKNNTVERFEPHGSSYPNKFNYNPNLLDDILYKIIYNIIYENINKTVILKYIKPVDYLPKIGFQNLDNNEITLNKNIGDPNGFCTMWCIWYLDYRLQHFNLNPYNLVKKLINYIKQNNYSFRTIIRNYSVNVTTLRDKYLSQVNKNINDYINNKLTHDDLNKLMYILI